MPIYEIIKAKRGKKLELPKKKRITIYVRRKRVFKQILINYVLKAFLYCIKEAQVKIFKKIGEERFSIF